jgi:hypothetical protein
MSIKPPVEWKLAEETEVLEENPLQWQTLCPQQFPRDLIWADAVGTQQLPRDLWHSVGSLNTVLRFKGALKISFWKTLKS